MLQLSFRRQTTTSALGLKWGSFRRRMFPPPCSRAECSSHRLAGFWSPRAPLCFGGLWYCSSACAEPAILRCLDQLGSEAPRVRRHTHRMPLGLLLLSRGELSEDQLQTALEAKRSGQTRRIGEWLQALNLASEEQVLAGLGLQWAVPVLSSPQSGLQSCAKLLPPVLRCALRLVPVRYVESSNQLYVASSEKVDQTVLTSMAQMLSCRIQPCLVSDRTLSGWLGTDLGVEEDATQSFERTTSLAEMIRITSSYAMRLCCDELRIARCQSHIWVRFSSRHEITHLVFRLSDSPLASHADSPYLSTAV